jgi:membrane-associated protease RseP (regulator of RpoE activity)
VSDTLRPPGTGPEADDRPWPTAGMPISPPPGSPPDPGTPGGPPAAPQPDPKGRELDHRFRLLLLVAILVGLGAAFGWSILMVVAAIVLSVFLHELGHFLVAKWCGMKVTEYFIGFGPRIWSFQRGETEYGLKVIPAGAYVRIIGMHSMEEVDPADEDRTYRSKSTPKRVAAVVAGPAMNFLIGLILLFVIFAGFGVPTPDKWEVSDVVPDSAAAAAGLQQGDRIVEWNGQPVGNYDVFVASVAPLAGEEVTFVVERDGERQTLTAPLGWSLQPTGAALLPGLRSGDRVLAVGDEQVTSYADVVEAMAAAQGVVEVTFESGGSEYVADISAPVTLPSDGGRGFLGVRGSELTETRSIPDAAGEAVVGLGDVVVSSVQGLGRLVSPDGLRNYADLFTGESDEQPVPEQGRVRPVDPSAATRSDTSGSSVAASADRPLSIVGIVQVGAHFAEEEGFAAFLGLLAVVNIFLGLINLVPLPPLDGGHIAVALYEGVRSRIAHRPYRIDISRLLPVTYAVFFILTAFGLSTIYLDIVDPVNLGP